MKKAIVLILALVLALCICACGKKDDGIDRKAIKTEFDKAVSYTETLVDTKDMTSTVQDESDGVYLFKQWNHTGDFVNADIDLDFELNGKTITLGTTTVGDLKAMGFDVECGFETLKPGDTASLAVYIDGKRCVFDTATNDSDSEKSIDEMPLNAFINDDLGKQRPVILHLLKKFLHVALACDPDKWNVVSVCKSLRLREAETVAVAHTD